MKLLQFLSLYILLLLLAGLLSCEKDDVINQGNIPIVNKAPVADAGPDQVTILPKDHVTLDGKASSDPDGTITKYLWSKISGPASLNIISPASSTTSVQSLVVGVYEFELMVTDDKGATAKDTAKVTVRTGNGNNQPPVAYAGSDQSITLPTTYCMLNGSSSFDPDGSLSAYQWNKVSGPSSFAFQTPAAVQTTVYNLVMGTYQFELAVTDDGGLTAKDTVQVIVSPASSTGCDISNRPVFTATLTEAGSLSAARVPSVAVAGSKIFFAGGSAGAADSWSVFSVVDIFDVNTRVWTQTKLSQARAGIATVSCGNKVFFAGGTDVQGDRAFTNVDIYDTETDNWTVAHLSAPRGAMAAAAVGNKVIFAGGTPNWWQGSNRVDLYDLSTGKWSTASLSEAKMDIGAVTVGDKVYFAGGEDLGNVYKGVDIYDNSNNQWSTSSLKELYGGLTGTVVGDQIYWAGLAFVDGPDINKITVSKVETWNTRTGTISVNCLSYARYRPDIVKHNNNILFFGWDFGLGVANSFDVYHTLTGSWSKGLIDQSIASAVFVEVNNTIYMAGGFRDPNNVTNKVYKLSW